MKVYFGTGGPNPKVYVEDRFVPGKRESEPLKHYQRHSPDGFNWGYAGSGPADLAFSLLVDAQVRYGVSVKDAIGVAERHYQRFKGEMVANMPLGDDWCMPACIIFNWVEYQERMVQDAVR